MIFYGRELQVLSFRRLSLNEKVVLREFLLAIDGQGGTHVDKIYVTQFGGIRAVSVTSTGEEVERARMPSKVFATRSSKR